MIGGYACLVEYLKNGLFHNVENAHSHSQIHFEPTLFLIFKILTPGLHTSLKSASSGTHGGTHDDEVDKIFFSDEKFSTFELFHNSQNGRVIGKSSNSIDPALKRVIRGHHPQQVMVFLAVSTKKVTDLVFVSQGVKIRVRNYIDDILQPAIYPANPIIFKNDHWNKSRNPHLPTKQTSLKTGCEKNSRVHRA
jgi:hypothetical protein